MENLEATLEVETVTTAAPVETDPPALAPEPPPPADVREEEIGTRTQARVRGTRSSIDYYRSRIAEMEKEIPEIEGKVRECFAVYDALKAAGFDPKLSPWFEEITVTTTEKDLIPLARILHSMPESGRELVNPDAPAKYKESRMIRVSLRPTKYPFVTVEYVTKATPGMACEIQTVVTKERKLVCKRQ